MTTIYMIRNAECSDLQDASSEFSEAGKKEQEKIQTFFEGKQIDEVYVSSLKSAADTLRFLINEDQRSVHVAEEFNERKIGPRVLNLESFVRRQWSEPEYKLSGGESFFEVQDRVLDGLERIVTTNKDKVSIIGSHGMAIATVIQFFDETFTCEDYLKTSYIRPWIVKMEFEDKSLVGLELIQCM